ncbi:hypothetical protein B0J11DRAFT_537421 [Dendryphion nanum]|uniref:Zn(2)-C6 fungal-type domain-containing protein n=1 Tax=Dendryphion nanum TaxID=256645 RepID=A0A9P9DD18_9PLEO|nr:hypothetical protein B0J11DRAFT_537421 [Dendryphion nanum]
MLKHTELPQQQNKAPPSPTRKVVASTPVIYDDEDPLHTEMMMGLDDGDSSEESEKEIGEEYPLSESGPSLNPDTKKTYQKSFIRLDSPPALHQEHDQNATTKLSSRQDLVGSVTLDLEPYKELPQQITPQSHPPPIIVTPQEFQWALNRRQSQDAYSPRLSTDDGAPSYLMRRELNAQRAQLEPSNQMPRLEHTTKREAPCSTCRRRKTKCDGRKPCSRCRRTGRECDYPIHDHKIMINPTESTRIRDGTADPGSANTPLQQNSTAPILPPQRQFMLPPPPPMLGKGFLHPQGPRYPPEHPGSSTTVESAKAGQKTNVSGFIDCFGNKYSYNDNGDLEENERYQYFCTVPGCKRFYADGRHFGSHIATWERKDPARPSVTDGISMEARMRRDVISFEFPCRVPECHRFLHDEKGRDWHEKVFHETECRFESIYDHQ